MLTPGNKRRHGQLYEAALNLGMSKDDAQVYADKALTRELETGVWHVSPQCAEARHDHR